MNDEISKHCDELNRCNQRGGRMLSVFDLLAAKTLDLDLAAYWNLLTISDCRMSISKSKSEKRKSKISQHPEQAREQICDTNSVRSEHFNKFELLIFLRIENGYLKANRWIEDVYSGDGSSGHELIFNANDKRTLDENAKHYLAGTEYVAACRDFLTKISPKVRTIEDTRRHVVEFLRQNPSA